MPLIRGLDMGFGGAGGGRGRVRRGFPVEVWMGGVVLSLKSMVMGALKGLRLEEEIRTREGSER